MSAHLRALLTMLRALWSQPDPTPDTLPPSRHERERREVRQALRWGQTMRPATLASRHFARCFQAGLLHNAAWWMIADSSPDQTARVLTAAEETMKEIRA